MEQNYLWFHQMRHWPGQWLAKEKVILLLSIKAKWWLKKSV